MLGVQYGAKPVPVLDEQLTRIRPVAIEWFTAIADAIGPSIEARDKKLAAAPSILAAIGAVGHELVNIDDPADRRSKMNSLTSRLRAVDWSRGPLWEGIAGKFTPKGVFSIGGSKETAYAVYDALHDENSPSYLRVRPTSNDTEQGREGKE